MQGSLGSIIWTICYLSVLIGLSAYGIHRYVIIYLFLKNRKRPVAPQGYFAELPKVTIQLPIFNEVYVVKRLLRSVSEIDYPRQLLHIQVLDDSTDETKERTGLHRGPVTTSLRKPAAISAAIRPAAAACGARAS
jgi:cellulose synthase/poly-beta-1,6-N-acetylglucosamine synthase-like glycosyltransferase